MNLIINTGSETIKYCLFDGNKKIFSRVLEGRARGKFWQNIRQLSKGKAISAMGFRIVHGGQLFREPRVVTATVLKMCMADLPGPGNGEANPPTCNVVAGRFPLSDYPPRGQPETRRGHSTPG